MTKYWIYQLTGWLGYSTVGITINLIGGAAPAPLLWGHLLLVSSGIGFTHLLRHEIHRRRSPQTPLSDLWPLLTLAGAAISIVLAVLVIGVNRVLAHSTWDFMSALALWWGMLLATGVWIILYVRFSEQRRQELRENQLQLALREARLLVLETQINPHFLFNALNSIRALVEIEPVAAQDMLTRLSNVLRNSLRLDDGRHTVPLGSELENVSDYLALETIRFSDRLQSTVAVDDAAFQCQIPRMMLQTLVENAVKHGIAQVKGRADLLIRASATDHNLLISVENTGKLFSSRGDGVHLGLQNIQERLKLLYGNRASLRLEENSDRVVATIAIPVTV